MTEAEVKELYGKSIWEMTPQELVENNLDGLWYKLVEEVDA